MISLQKWKAISQWLIENKESLPQEEKNHWLEQLRQENEQVLLLWSEGIDLLDELNEQLISSQSLFFKKKLEKTEGISLFELGIFDKAIDCLKEELSQTQHPARINLYLGYSYLYLNAQEAGREALINANQQTNDPLEKHFALLGLGLHSGRAGNIEEAITHFEKADALLFNPDLVYNLGICYLLLHMPMEAIPYFQKIVELGEDVSEACYWLGRCYMESGHMESALEVWYHAIQEFSNEKLLFSLAAEFEEKGFFSGAIYCYEKLADLGVQPVTVRHGILWNYGLMDEKNKVKVGFQELLEDYPDHENVWISYLWLLHKWQDKNFHSEKNTALEQGITHPLINMLT